MPTPNELLDSFAAEIASNDVSSKPSENETSEGTGDTEQEENSALEKIDEEITETGEKDGEILEQESLVSLTPPGSMTAGEAEQFGGLTPEMQEFVVRREQDRDSHLTRSTQQLADTQREVDAQKTKWNEQLGLQAQTLTQIVGDDIEPPAVELRGTDPEQYDEQMAAYVHSLHTQKQAEKQLYAVRQEQAVERTRQQTLEAASIKKLIPEFGDPEKAGPLQQRIFNYAQTSGYTTAELSNVSANDIVVLHKAMLYDDMAKSGRKIANKSPGKSAPKSAKPGVARGFSSKRVDKFNKLQKDLRKGDDKAMIGLFEMQLESESYGTSR